MYMANASPNAMGSNATYIPPTRVGSVGARIGSVGGRARVGSVGVCGGSRWVDWGSRSVRKAF